MPSTLKSGPKMSFFGNIHGHVHTGIVAAKLRSKWGDFQAQTVAAEAQCLFICSPQDILGFSPSFRFFRFFVCFSVWSVFSPSFQSLFVCIGFCVCFEVSRLVFVLIYYAKVIYLSILPLLCKFSMLNVGL